MKSLRTEKKKCGEGGDSSVREGNESAIPSCYEDADTRCSLGGGTGLRVLERQQGFRGLHILTESDKGEGILVSFWETEADAQASETNASYIGQMSMMSSFLYEALTPQTYEADVLA